MLLRGSAVRSIGGFDERMFFYYEDVDLCLRFRDKGYKVMYTGQAKVFHEHMGSSGKWYSGRTTFLSNMKRIKSIQRRKGWPSALVEFVRSPCEWLILSLYGKISGQTYREMIEKKTFQVR